MVRETTELQWRAGTWHRDRFPYAQSEHVALKAAEEVGEVARAVNGEVGFNSATGGGSVIEEAADVVIALMVLVDRWTDDDLMAAVDAKLTLLERPGAHRASALGA